MAVPSSDPPILEWQKRTGRALSKTSIREAQEELGPLCILAPGTPPAYLFSHPGPYYLPFSSRGWDYFVEQHVAAFTRAGIGPGSVVDVAVSFHMVPAGLGYEQALRRIGSAVVPGGAGQHVEHARGLGRLGVDWLIGFGSFLEEIVRAASPAPRLAGVLAVGEPVSAGSPLRAASRFVQTYGTAEAGPVAVTCANGNLHEVRPGTVRPGPVAAGDEGIREVLIDLPDRPDLPFDGFETGDYSAWIDCPCGAGTGFSAPRRTAGGVHRSRGIFFSDGDVAAVLRESGYAGRFSVDARDVTAAPRLVLDAPPASAEALAAALRERLRLRFEVVGPPSVSR